MERAAKGTGGSMDVTRTLARYVVGARPEDVPAAAKREAVRSIVNWVGCSVGGCEHRTVDLALSALAPFAGPAQATVLGRHERTDILNAALLNGISSHVFDFDDTHLKTIIHPSGPVASALLALAEYHPCTGGEFLHAFILGVEVECRIGNSVYPEHYDIGWHITGTAGVFGAAAAAGKILGLNEQQMTWALGIAGTQSSGFREMFGTMCKSLHPGRAAQNGLASALLAQRGFTSSDRVLEAPRGFTHVMSTARRLSEITEGLGSSFEISLNTYKPFACGIVIHPAIDGCVQLRNEFGLIGDEIDRIVLRVAPLVLELTGKRTPQVGLEGKFSVYHSAAVAILYGAAGEKQYSDATVRNPNVIALRDRVDAVVEKSIRDDEAYVTIHLKNGTILEKHVEHAIGSLYRPMSDHDLEAKFCGLTADILTNEESRRLLDLCWNVESSSDVASLAKATVPRSPITSAAT
jgi:2-methylcitrate dehydratase PrpD